MMMIEVHTHTTAVLPVVSRSVVLPLSHQKKSVVSLNVICGGDIEPIREVWKSTESYAENSCVCEFKK
jgi:hypothetical protein